jgi:hypothetical protein
LFSKLKINLDHEGVLVDCALSDRIVVARAFVDIGRRLQSLLDGLELNDWHQDCKLHDLRLHQVHLLEVPLGSLQIEATDV